MVNELFTQADQAQMARRGSDPYKASEQIEIFKRGVPFQELTRACTIGDGIQRLDETACLGFLAGFEKARGDGRIMKMVPASGAASRMFKDLFTAMETLEAGGQPQQASYHDFLKGLTQFAFYPELAQRLKDKDQDAAELAADGKGLPILKTLLEEMDYGGSPKGLLSFHRHDGQIRTPIEEHLAEAAAYAADELGRATLHFTVSPEHMQRFKERVEQAVAGFPGTRFRVHFSIQKPSTDTIAVTPDNQPFRQADGSLLFRPGGHGALIENLNDLEGDIIFIKNIDNVVPPRLHEETVFWKKVLGGYLVYLQERVANYLNKLSPDEASRELQEEVITFVAQFLGLKVTQERAAQNGYQLTSFLRSLMNRPIRVCGMVKAEGEPGGGPYWTRSNLGESLQIVESAQMDTANPQQAKMMQGATHFNPVDLVCGVRDYRGRCFDLTDFIDHNACFISEKSKDGKPLKALELPGLWNGAMAGWNTAFVEVPLSTFNPVKTVNDLLRDAHR